MTEIRTESTQTPHRVMPAFAMYDNPHALPTHPYGQQFAGYPDSFITELHYGLNQHSTHPHHAHAVVVAINNLPMIISGYGHDTTEQACAGLIAALKLGISVLGDVMIVRIQKEQIGLVLHPHTALSAASLEGIIRARLREFQHLSSYGMIHLLCDAVSIMLDDRITKVADIIDNAYMTLKQKATSPHYELPRDEHEALYNRQEMNMVNYLSDAINNKLLCLAYQPIVCSRTGNIEHYEALLRIRKDDGTLSSAGPLIPVAERMGLIDIIDDLVLDMIVKQLRASPELKLAFNVSNLTTTSALWLKKLEKVAHDTPDIMPRMMIEITETAVHLDIKRTAYFVASVQSFGAMVALDDFGSGYTSFRQLKTLSVDIIKIDGVFVKDLVDNHDNMLFIKTMLDFTNGFGLKTVAEFVENGETAKLLMKLGVEYLQGYYFGFPERMEHWERG
jgi:EAL domain-containing protein (putative c-di-GMP-specific phosphodiesterase class I)/GGDEF domain-containing protein